MRSYLTWELAAFVVLLRHWANVDLLDILSLKLVGAVGDKTYARSTLNDRSA